MTTQVTGTLDGVDLIFERVSLNGKTTIWKAITILDESKNSWTAVLEAKDDAGNVDRVIRVIQKEDHKMSKLKWDQDGEKTYELGVDHGVLYRHTKTEKDGKTVVNKYAAAYAWNGLTGVDEGTDGGDANKQYADNIVYLNLMGTEEFNPTISAFTIPDAFKECDGSKELVPGVYMNQQDRQEFGFSYRTKMGNDIEGEAYGYKIHLCYGLKAQPSERNYETINDTPEAIEFSWECSSTPVDVTGANPTSHLVIESVTCTAEFLSKLEEVLYGTDSTEGRLPLPDEIVKMYQELSA